MRRLTSVVVTALSLSALTACGGSSSIFHGSQATSTDIANDIKVSYSEWTDVVNGADHCRELWADSSGALIDQLNGQTCYIQEQTIGISSDTAVSMLTGHVPPADLQPLATDTVQIVKSIHAVDLKAACGDGTNPDLTMSGCQKALDDRAAAYKELHALLVKWAPVMGLTVDDSTGLADHSSVSTDDPGLGDTSTPDGPQMTVSQSNAVDRAQGYLDAVGESHDSMIKQLIHDGFSPADAKYGADNCGADWNEQAAKVAQGYQDAGLGYSRAAMIHQLVFSGFTSAQATYGADSVGLK